MKTRKNQKICKGISFILIFAFTLSFFILPFNELEVEASFKPPFEVASKNVYMVNSDTNAVIYENNAHEIVYPASLTKIMTAIVALENVSDLEGTVVKAPAYVYNEFAGVNVSHADIKQGEEMRMIDLLYGMILQSACEASNIIADYVGGGSIEKFVKMMNDKAKEIGATNTHFENAHGLFNEKQVTTAYDMYLITKYALQIPMFEKISTTVSYLTPATNKHDKERYLIHTNNMLSKNRGGSLYYPYIKGVKTGSLPEVGKNLVSIGSKSGFNYTLVTIGAPEKDSAGQPLKQNQSYVDAKNLYEWAFNNFTNRTIVTQGQIIDEIKVGLSSGKDYVTLVSSKDLSTLLLKDVESTAILTNIIKNENVKAPVKKGDVLGKVEYKLSDKVIGSVDLIATEDVGRSTFLYAIDVTKRFLSQPLVKALLIILAVLILLYIVYAIRYNKIKKRRMASSRVSRKRY